MPAEFWYPLSTATASLPYDQWTLGAGSNKNVAQTVTGGRAGPAVHDDDTTQVNEGSGASGLNRAQSCNVDWPSPIASISALTFGSKTRSSGGASTRTLNWSNAAGTLGGTIHSSADGTDTYVTLGPTDVSDGPTYRPGGGAYATSDFDDSTSLFPYIIVTVSNNTVCTSIWGVLTYSPPSGGFAFLLGLAGLMSLQLAGPMTDYTQFDKFLQWRHDIHPRHTIMTDGEKVTAWDEYKSYTHPRFFYG